MVRQSSFILDNYLYFYDGFAENNQIQPIGVLSKINLERLFKDNDYLIGKIMGKNNNNYSYNNYNQIESPNKHEKKNKFKLNQDVVIGSRGVYNENSDEDMDVNSSVFRKVSIEKLPYKRKII